MSHTLAFAFVLDSEKSQRYWWPLILESMGWHSFHFSAPDLPDGRGYYHYVHTGNPVEVGPASISSIPFKVVWDEIFSETGEVLISLWSTIFPDFNVDISVIPAKEDRNLQVHLYLDGTQLMGYLPQEVKERLRVVFECAKTLYQVCQPCTGKAYWEYAGDASALWAFFGKTPDAASFARFRHRFQLEREPQLVIHKLPNSDHLFLFDPIPIPKKGGWDFISLLEG